MSMTNKNSDTFHTNETVKEQRKVLIQWLRSLDERNQKKTTSVPDNFSLTSVKKPVIAIDNPDINLSELRKNSENAIAKAHGVSAQLTSMASSTQNNKFLSAKFIENVVEKQTRNARIATKFSIAEKIEIETDNIPANSIATKLDEVITSDLPSKTTISADVKKLNDTEINKATKFKFSLNKEQQEFYKKFNSTNVTIPEIKIDSDIQKVGTDLKITIPTPPAIKAIKKNHADTAVQIFLETTKDVTVPAPPSVNTVNYKYKHENFVHEGLKPIKPIITTSEWKYEKPSISVTVPEINKPVSSLISLRVAYVQLQHGAKITKKIKVPSLNLDVSDVIAALNSETTKKKA